MRRRWLLLVVILTAPSGCDNVTWGGIDVRLQDPPSREDMASQAEEEGPEDAAVPGLPPGPVLFAGTREGDGATLVAVGQVTGDGLAELPTEEEAPGFREHLARRAYAPGTELILFAEGVRAGRLTVTANGTDQGYCAPRPTVTGVLELVPGASGATRFLALPDSAARRRPWGPVRPLNHDYEQRVASLALAQEAIPRVGAPWPPSLLESRADIQAFRRADAPGPSVAATFLYGDRLGVVAPRPGAYALFVMASQAGGAYRSDYVWYRAADTEGKGAPRYFGHLDWDGDGASDVLLDVFGAERRWFASLGRRNGTWVRTFQDRCGGATG